MQQAFGLAFSFFEWGWSSTTRRPISTGAALRCFLVVSRRFILLFFVSCCLLLLIFVSRSLLLVSARFPLRLAASHWLPQLHSIHQNAANHSYYSLHSYLIILIVLIILILFLLLIYCFFSLSALFFLSSLSYFSLYPLLVLIIFIILIVLNFSSQSFHAAGCWLTVSGSVSFPCFLLGCFGLVGQLSASAPFFVPQNTVTCERIFPLCDNTTIDWRVDWHANKEEINVHHRHRHHPQQHDDVMVFQPGNFMWCDVIWCGVMVMWWWGHHHEKALIQNPP